MGEAAHTAKELEFGRAREKEQAEASYSEESSQQPRSGDHGSPIRPPRDCDKS